MLITTSSISLIGIITNYNILLVIALMTGIGTALFHPAATSHVSHIAKKRRNTVISIFIQIGSIGFASSGNYLNVDVPLTIGFLNLPTFLIFLPITTFMAKIGAESVHKFDKKLIGKIFGIYLFVISCSLFYEYYTY